MKNDLDSISNIAIMFRKFVDNADDLTPSDIHILTKMSNEEFYAALGWLARDNKICKSDVWKGLRATKLTSNIGTNAGKVWTALTKHEKFDISTISTLTHLNKIDTYTALGWLARENKIDLHKKNDVIVKLPNNTFYNIEMKDNTLRTDKKPEFQLVTHDEDDKLILETITKNSAESLTRMFSDSSIKDCKDPSKIEKIIDLKFKGFDS